MAQTSVSLVPIIKAMQVAEASGLRRRIYFVQAADGGPIKIGTAADLQQRMAGLQCMSPVPLVLLGSFPGTISVERDLHAAFDHLRRYGEWFAPEEPLLGFIAEYGSSTRPAMLPLGRVGPYRTVETLRADLRNEKSKVAALQLKVSELQRQLDSITTCRKCGIAVPRGERLCHPCQSCDECGLYLYEGDVDVCKDCRLDLLMEQGVCMTCGNPRDGNDPIECEGCASLPLEAS